MGNTLLYLNIMYQVDDSTMARKMLVKMLSSLGSVVHQASDGQEAIDLVREAIVTQEDKVTAEDGVQGAQVTHRERLAKSTGMPYDLILMDSAMPRVSGPEATETILQQLGFNKLIVGVTGNVLPADTNGKTTLLNIRMLLCTVTVVMLKI